MNARNLNKAASSIDWARIDRMTDEEIDTSDIPPLDDDFFARAKWRLPRSYIDRNDFLQARKLAVYILNRKLHDKRKTEEARARQQLVHLAFNTSLVVSYSRPFHWNKNLKGEPDSSLRKCVGEVLSSAEIQLHKKILKQRDTTYAHSAASSHRIENFDYTRHFALMHVVENLTKSEIAMAQVISEKWIKYLDKVVSSIKLQRSL